MTVSQETLPAPIDLVLPMPPSVNGMFVNRLSHIGGGRRGRKRSDKYEAWQREAGLMVIVAKSKGMAKPVTGKVTVEVTYEDKGRRDLDNAAKAVLDLLVYLHLIEDDSREYVRRITLDWGDIDGCRVIVRPVEGERETQRAG